ncbi:DUF3379 family protein [Acinetobacter sp. ANC 4805]|uniref:DUF3379 family protein n=1 Tax=Acinetobacter sp. ANC 4805 TaxID=2923425 RepID=UPI001F4AEFC9|nr:DUF3379 family protein [Acinetobacter sp. ANC 4805]MCH7312156.1 DUF3379 domain-containing protein [Acinetobacter sp. ANC 4805]
MNCITAHRLLLENPANDDPTLLKHLQECCNCQNFANQLRKQELLLKDALEIDTPPKLAERILLNTILRKPRWQPYAFAASIIFMVFLGVGNNYLQQQRTTTWSEVILSHVLNERASLKNDDQISPDQLSAALVHFNLNAKSNIGRIRFLEPCEMPGGKGLHVVIDTVELGQVTLILPPKGAHIDTGYTQREGFIAKLVHVDKVTIGVVTEHPDKLEQLDQWLNRNLYMV